MKKSFIIICLIFSSLSFINAQLDFSTQYHKQVFSEWSQVIESYYPAESKIMQNAYSFGIGYRYFPHSVRVGYVPELGVSYTADEKKSIVNDTYNKYNIIQSYLSFAVQIFPLDMEGDCNCPTFSKQNDFFKKAFFLKFIPEVAYQFLQIEDFSEKITDQNFVYSFGLGTGINIALTQKFSIAPEVSYHFIFNEKWDDFADYHFKQDSYDKTSAYNFRAGLRFSFYFN